MNSRMAAVAAYFLLLFSFVPPIAAAEANIKAVIDADRVSIKARPSAESESIIGIPKGEAVLVILCLKDSDIVLGATGHWCLVRYRGVDGWVFDSALNSADPQAEASYRDVPPLSEEINRLEALRESQSLDETEAQCRLIIERIEGNFSHASIIASARLSGVLLGVFSDRIEALVYLRRFEEARAAYAYFIKTYPDARLEDAFTTAGELLDPYMVFIDSYSSAPLYTAPGEPMKKVKSALEKRDLSRVSDLALPGVFEVWVAHTDWIIRLGDERLDRQAWLSDSWDTAWEIGEVSTRMDEAGDIVGYCIVTEPWNLNYYEIRVDRVDFCVDRLPDGSYAFSYMTLYTRPIQ